MSIEDPEIQAIVIDNLRRCPFIKPACRAAGVHAQRFFEWRKRCEEGDPEAEHMQDFFLKCDMAVGKLEVDMVDNIIHLPKGTRGKMWMLQRWRPDRYGNKAHVTSAQEIPAPPKAIEDMSETELEAYIKLFQAWLFGKLDARERLRGGEALAIELGAPAPGEEADDEEA